MTTTIIDKPVQDALWPDGERMPVILAGLLGKANRIADAGADFLAAADKLLAKDDGPMGREAKASPLRRGGASPSGHHGWSAMRLAPPTPRQPAGTIHHGSARG